MDGDSLQLTIRLTTHPVNAVPSNHPVAVDRSATVADLKQQLHREFDGKPQPEGILCVKGGRVCKDSEVLGELFGAEVPADEAVLHVIVRPNSWSAPFTTLPKSTPMIPVDAAPAPITPQVPTTPSPAPHNPTNAGAPPGEAPTSPAEGLTNAFASTFAGAAPSSTTAASVSPTTPSLGPSVAGFPTYLAFLSQLIPLQRSLLLLNLQKAHYYYSQEVTERLAHLGWAESSMESEGDGVKQREGVKTTESGSGEGEVGEIKNLLIECGLWGTVQEKEEEAETEIRDWGKGRRENAEFQLVQINGLPFMLQAPVDPNSTFQSPPDLALYRSLKRGQAILHILTTMLQLLITYQPTAPAIAYGRALLRPPGAAATAGGAAVVGARAAAAGVNGAVPPAAAAAAANRRRATVSIVINLEAVLSLIVPLFLLSLKLGFLLWIFGRHASSTKRIVMGSMAAAWILWEGVGMYRRRAVAGALRDRADRERDRAERQARRADAAAQAGIPLPPAAAAARRPAPAPPAGGAGGGGVRQRVVPAGAIPPGAPAPGHPAPRAHRPPGARPRREPHSRLSPRYWIARIATIGLVEEAHELGLAPRTVAGRHVPQPAPQPRPNDRAGLARQARRRALRTALVAVVLFFGTLSPEVERKRKRALEKRERLLAEKRVQRERQAAERAAAAGGAARIGGGAVGGGQEERTVGGLQPPEPRSGASTPGLFEGDHGEATHGLPQHPPPQASTSSHAGPSSPTPSTSQQTRDDSERTPTTSPAGRAVVSDAELFADGLGEPEQDPIALPDTTSPSEPAQDGDGDGTEGENETSEDEADEGPAEEGEVDQVVALF